MKGQSYFKKLFTVHCSPPHPPLTKGGRRGGKDGFSLIEIIMIIIVVSIAIPALLILIGGEAGRGVEPELRITATNVGQQLLDEIMTKCWDETSVSGTTCIQTAAGSTTLGPDTLPDETSLSLYDDADDFNDMAPASLGTTPCTDTVTVNNVSFTRAVDVCYVNPAALNTCVDTAPAAGSCNRTIASGSQTDYKLITVTVTAPDNNWGSSVVLTTLVTNY